MRYTTNGTYAVWAGKTAIALAYWDEIKVLQGMPRMETIQKIKKDCPEFLTNNNWDENRVPMLFSEATGKRYKKTTI